MTNRMYILQRLRTPLRDKNHKWYDHIGPSPLNLTHLSLNRLDTPWRLPRNQPRLVARTCVCISRIRTKPHKLSRAWNWTRLLLTWRMLLMRSNVFLSDVSEVESVELLRPRLLVFLKVGLSGWFERVFSLVFSFYSILLDTSLSARMYRSLARKVGQVCLGSPQEPWIQRCL